ncbi:tyrosine-type recombinase/integrase [Luteimicrobium subarcticum]|uniref:Phage integrase family protein n=1 Tax=Luteimicrobium subarcticum TaxID=620910 RepID=A0A2M8WR76_9MICO|nr:tyrosine-type recombinase/integrase [Luteimicrobium subarcticum]PJI93441.1 phage integrase family protein [Luteimicrobium subarcticum]
MQLKLAPSTTTMVMRFVSGVFNQAVTDRMLADPPAKGVKTTASYRLVPLSDVTLDLLEEHRERFGGTSTGLVFSRRQGGPHKRVRFSHDLVVARQRAGMEDVWTMHDLRHYYASLLIRHGASVKTPRGVLRCWRRGQPSARPGSLRRPRTTCLPRDLRKRPVAALLLPRGPETQPAGQRL